MTEPTSTPRKAEPLERFSLLGIGLLLAILGFFLPWGATEAGSFLGVSGMIGGATLAMLLWYALRGVPFGKTAPAAQVPLWVPAVAAAWGLLGLANGFGLLGGALKAFGLPNSTGGLPLGAILTAVGGGVATWQASCWEAPAAEQEAQYTRSLLAYLFCLAGVLTPWGDKSGALTIGGGLTTLIVGFACWWAWSGIYRSAIVRKLAIVPLIAPTMPFFYGAAGLMGWGGQDWGWAVERNLAEAGLLAGAGGILLCFGGAVYAYIVLGQGVKAAVAIAKQQKEAELAARKKARDERRAKRDQNG